jgi:hypothetical protein
MAAGRPRKEFDKKAFADLIGFGCSQEEICWFFRDKDTGIPANPDTLSRWCKRTYGMNFQEFKKQNELMPLKIQLRKNQLELSKKSAAMAIFLGKNYLGQSDKIEQVVTNVEDLSPLAEMLKIDDENTNN